MSLLEEAKKIKHTRTRTKKLNSEEVELAVGWAKYEVSGMQVIKALKTIKQNNYYSFLSRALAQYIRDKDL